MAESDNTEEKLSSNGQIHLRAFALSLGTICALLTLIISIWSRTTGFATEFWQIYESLHPSPFNLAMIDPTFLKHAIGVSIDLVYAFLDGFIFASLWAVLYNLFLPKRS